MDLTWQAIGIGVAVFVALLALWMLSRKKGSEPAATTEPAIAKFTGNVEEPQPVQPIDAFEGERSNIPQGNFEAEVRMLIDYGNKNAAIRVLREKLGLDLKDAKDLADKLEQGAPIPAGDRAQSTQHAEDADPEVRELVHSGRLIEAIKLVREKKGLDLKAAKAYVERL